MKKVIFGINAIVLLCIIILMFSTGFAKVEGNSMKPFLENNNIIIYKKSINKIKRFDIIIFKINEELLIKRVIGLPGEQIEYLDNTLYVNGKIIKEPFQKSITNDFSIPDITANDIIPNNKILVLGDNRLYSHDSRFFGLIDMSDIDGIMIMKIF